MNLQAEFAAAIAAAGLQPPEVIEADGRLHRFASSGKRGDAAGWYVLHGDSLPVGTFGDWRSGARGTWRASGRTLSNAEEAAHRERIAAARREAEAARAEELEQKATLARRLYDAAKPLKEHPYIERKKLTAIGRARVLEVPLRDGRPTTALRGLCAVVPIYRDRNIVAVQLIDAEGQKRFVASPTGGFFPFASHDDSYRKMIVCEGWATGSSIYAATGTPTFVAFSAGNILVISRYLRARAPKAVIIIAADNDGNGVGQRAAEEAARAVGGLIALPDFGENLPDGASDFNDLARLRGLKAVRAGIDAASAAPQPHTSTPTATVADKPTEGPTAQIGAAASSGATSSAEDSAHVKQTDRAELEALAALSLIEYDRQRKTAAERLEIRVETLDAEVRKLRDEARGEERGEAMFPVREPWEDPVDGVALVAELSETLGRFVVLPAHADVALALWIVATYLVDAIDVAPILAVVSPEKRCGKTTLLAMLARLVHRAMAASNISPAALFRAIEKWSPTLLIDEGDAFLGDNEELRGILNSGHTRDSAFVIRCVGDEQEPARFSTWGLKALALIGKLPDTLADRSIAIELRRKIPSERVAKLRHGADLEPLARKCLRWATDNADRLRSVRPAIPEELSDRAGDNWEPLLAIADLIGCEWPKAAREAASVLSGATADGDSTKVELLRDLLALFRGRLAGRDAFRSAELVDALAEDKAGRWAEYSHGKPLTQRQLARLLRPFAIVPNTVRSGAQTFKGYRLEAFADAFARYLSHFDPSHRHAPTTARVVTDKRSDTEDAMFRIDDPSQASNHAGCDVVTDENHDFDGAAAEEAGEGGGLDV